MILEQQTDKRANEYTGLRSTFSESEISQRRDKYEQKFVNGVSSEKELAQACCYVNQMNQQVVKGELVKFLSNTVRQCTCGLWSRQRYFDPAAKVFFIRWRYGC